MLRWRCLPPQPAQSLMRFTVPIAKPATSVLLPTDDTVLRAGSFQAASLSGTEPSLTVATSSTAAQVRGSDYTLMYYTLIPYTMYLQILQLIKSGPERIVALPTCVDPKP